MGKTRILVLTLGIPGLLLYGTLVTAQWRGNAALVEFTKLQKQHPADSMKIADSKITAQKLEALALAVRLIPDQSNPAYQTALQNLVLAESESLHPTGSPKNLEGGLDTKVTVLLREALRFINLAITLNPGEAEYYFVKSTTLQNLQAGLSEQEAATTAEAVTCLLTTADGLNPYAPSLHYRMGSFWLALGDREQAKHSLAIAIVDSYHYARPIFDLLWASAADVPEMTVLVGESPLAQALFADFLWEKGFKTEAVSAYAAAERGHPMEFRVAELLVEQGFRTGGFELARRVLKTLEGEMRDMSPSQMARLRYFEGQSYYLERRYQDATTSLETALRLDPGLYYIHEMLGKVYAIGGDYDRAIARFRFLLDKSVGQVSPREMAGIHVELAQVYEKKHLYLQALDQYIHATQLDPMNQVAQKRAVQLGREHL